MTPNEVPQAPRRCDKQLAELAAYRWLARASLVLGVVEVVAVAGHVVGWWTLPVPAPGRP